MDWIHLAEGLVAGCCEHNNEPLAHKMWGISWPAKELSVYQGLCTMTYFD
jgi:hypothetical protein